FRRSTGEGMPHDPVENLVGGYFVLYSVLSPDQFDPPIESGSEIGKERGDYFNILDLPTELISHTFSFLSMEDRMRAAGVNKRLKGIELASPYYVERVLIEEAEEVPNEIKEWMMMMKDAVDVGADDDKEEDLDFYATKISQRITFYKDKSYFSDCIKRIAQNVSIRILEIKLTGSEEFHREIFNLAKEFNEIEYLDLGIEGYDNEILKEMMVDSFLFDLTRACKMLYLNVSTSVCEKITPEALHQLSKNMIDGSTKCRGLCIRNFHNDRCIDLLKLIGITYRDDTLFSEMDIEVYEWRTPDGTVVAHSIFDGYLKITFGSFTHSSDLFSIDLYETQETLQQAKNKNCLFKIDISPE
ncbi:hypothetical protein PENTCL1PPCAC_19577, partial [Pristionchus entomophagus]